MKNISTFFDSRKSFCHERLEILKDKISTNQIINKYDSKLCIYITGSYARFEAHSNSDLDLFFLHIGNEYNDKIPRLQKTLIDAEIIKLAKELGFPEFSNDGQYLQIHSIENILDALGCPEDDHKNYFTARMLLLLESFPLYKPELYDQMVKQIIGAYYRDYHDHDRDFRANFLVNDILRFWKTLCLNYEHKRNRKVDNETAKNRTHLKNLKLKFSRMVTCFATIILLIQSKKIVTPEELLKIVRLTPLERLNKAIDNAKIGKKIRDDILMDYIWFLKLTESPEPEILNWIGKKSNRNDAFDRGRKFGSKIYGVINIIADPTDIRYLIM